jgi:FlaA1/EpsC-like NDP-sugar epimerase
MSTRITLIRGTQVAIDLTVLILAFSLGFLVRFDWEVPAPMLYRMLVLWPYIVGLEYLLLVAFGVPRYVWRYVGLREVSRILLATAAATTVLIATRAAFGVYGTSWASYTAVPYGVIAINFVLAFLGIVGVRALRRLVAERWSLGSRRGQSRRLVRTLLVGAGQSGLLVAKEIQSRPELGIVPVGFLDDDLMKKGTTMHGIPVLGPVALVPEVARSLGAKQALITVSHAHGETVRRISDLCRQGGLEVKIIPGVSELVEGKFDLSRMRDVAIEDLLRREPVELEHGAIAGTIEGRVVMVTGAGGSIGSELCRQLCRFSPARLLLVERSENALFEIHGELARSFPAQASTPCLADLCDEPRMSELLDLHRPAVIFHAAAHKHVPMMEQNPGEAVKNNVHGTRLLCDLADARGVSCVVMISTDKAVHPSSVMGASKRAAEIYVQSLSRHSKTRFGIVRFGNVLGSAGSVVPIFKKQIAAGGPITITHPEMRRYFMTIPEAAQLVLQAGTMGDGGEVFILDMGEPVKVVDLARDLVRLSGFKPEEIALEFTGIRPGEKLSEELSTQAEQADKTRHPKILVGRTSARDLTELRQQLDRLLALAQGGPPEELRRALGQVVGEYRYEPAATASSSSRSRPALDGPREGHALVRDVALDRQHGERPAGEGDQRAGGAEGAREQGREQRGERISQADAPV